jgi:hypothetical protein
MFGAEHRLRVLLSNLVLELALELFSELDSQASKEKTKCEQHLCKRYGKLFVNRRIFFGET